MSLEPYYERSGLAIYHGDCRDILTALEPASVQCCVTSPPYWGLRDYGIPPSVWGGEADCDHKWGDAVAVNATNHIDKRRWNHARNGRGEDQPTEKLPGWKRQTIEQGKFCQSCGAWSGNLGLEPTPALFVEHIVQVFAAVRRVLKDDGTLWLNLGDCWANDGKWGGETGGKQAYLNDADRKRNGRGKRRTGLKPKDLVGIPWMCAFALRAAGWYLRSEIIWHKPNPMPESVTDRPTKAHEQIFLLAKSERYFYDFEAAKESSKGNGSGNKKKRWGTNHTTDRANGAGAVERQSSIPWAPGQKRRNRRSVWRVPTKPVKEAHFATFPPKLIEPCIMAVCPEGGVVLDPFSGSGTTGKVCKSLGRKFIGCELNASYIEIADKRIGAQEVLF